MWKLRGLRLFRAAEIRLDGFGLNVTWPRSSGTRCDLGSRQVMNSRDFPFTLA